MKNNRYHTSVKMCFSLGIEKEILRSDFISSIPYSTTSYWRKGNVPSDFLWDPSADIERKNIQDKTIEVGDMTRPNVHMLVELNDIWA